MVKFALFLTAVAALAVVGFGQDGTYIDVLTHAFKLFRNGPPNEKNLGNVAKILSNLNQKNILQTAFDVFLQNGYSSTTGNGTAESSKSFPDMTEMIKWMSKLSKYRPLFDSFLDSGNLTAMSSRITAMLSSNIPGFQQSQETQEILNNLVQLYDKFKHSPMTEKCTMDGLILFNGIRNFEMWAMKMVDSMGKIPVGILDGNLRLLGAFDQCRSIKSLRKSLGDSKQKGQSPINGKYCTIQIPLTSLIGSVTEAAGAAGGVFGTLYASLYLGLCIPESCSEAELIYIVNEVLSNITIANSTFEAFGPNCQEESIEYSSDAIAALCLSGFIILLMVIGTAYDIIYIQIPKQKQKPQQNGYTNSNKYKTELNGIEKDTYEVKDTKCKTHEPGLAGKLIISFSVYTNGKKLLNTKQSPGTITAINGIRFISMTWVILGHTFTIIIYNSKNIASYSQDLMNRWTFNAIENALISVDTFFTMSGLLMSYLILKEMKKKKGACGINWGLFYFHRFWRLTPPYIIIMFVYFATFPYWSDGPFWTTKNEPKSCENYWWRNLLYINNLFPVQDMCFAHAWYLANDMQFYIISPILFIPLFYNEIIGVLVCLLALVGTTVAAGLVSYNNKLPPSSFGGAEKGSNLADYFDTYYDKPWCRMGPYIVGILAGYILYKTNCKIRIHKFLNLSLWLICTALGCAILYGLFEPLRGNNLLSIEVSAVYNATHRSVWGFCVCWVIVACATGYGGFINTLLSWKAFVVLSRLSYIAYLIHPAFMGLYYRGIKDSVLLSDSYAVDLFLALLTKSYGIAFILSLACEAPMMALEKVLLAPVTKPKPSTGHQNGKLAKDVMGEKENEAVQKIP